MKCNQVQFLVSRYLDNDLHRLQRRWVEQHMACCSGCSAHFESLRALKAQMERLPPPILPADLVSEILSAPNSRGAREEGREWHFGLGSALDWCHVRPTGFAMVASFFITISMYLLILGNLKPVPIWTTPGHTEPITISSREFSDLNQLGLKADGGTYSLPRIMKTSGLEESLRNAPDRGVAVITLVRADGRASVVEVLTPRNRPDLADQLIDAIHEVSFRPAMTAGRPVATQFVLVLEKVEVRG